MNITIFVATSPLEKLCPHERCLIAGHNVTALSSALRKVPLRTSPRIHAALRPRFRWANHRRSDAVLAALGQSLSRKRMFSTRCFPYHRRHAGEPLPSQTVRRTSFPSFSVRAGA